MQYPCYSETSGSGGLDLKLFTPHLIPASLHPKPLNPNPIGYLLSSYAIVKTFKSGEEFFLFFSTTLFWWKTLMDTFDHLSEVLFQIHNVVSEDESFKLLFQRWMKNIRIAFL